MDYRKCYGRKNWKYQQNQRHKNRDLKIAKGGRFCCEMWIDYTYDEELCKYIATGKYVKRPKSSKEENFHKRCCSHKIRKIKDLSNYSSYKKYYDMWWFIW
jgi:hypothetical protein